MAGITDLALLLSTFTCDLTDDFIRDAMENTTVHNVETWSKEFIGDTVFKQRKEAFSSG